MSIWWSKLSRRHSAIRQALREADLSLLLQMGVFAATVPLLMRLKLARLQRLLETRGPSGSVSSSPMEVIVRHLQLARQIGSPLVRPGCLTRGVTLCYFLRRAGLDVTLSFGLRQVGDDFTGHCWLTRDGLPFLEDEDPRVVYVQMLAIPQDPAISLNAKSRDLRKAISK